VTIPKKITYYRSSPSSLAIDNFIECSKHRWLTIIPVTPNSNKHHEHHDKFFSLLLSNQPPYQHQPYWDQPYGCSSLFLSLSIFNLYVLHLNHTNCHHKIFYTSTYKLLFMTPPEKLRREEAMLHDLVGHSHIRLLEHQPIRFHPQMHMVYIRQHCFGSLWQFLSCSTTVLIVFRPWFQLILEMSSILEGQSTNSNNLFYKLLKYCEI
jgi:hypothetical protein